MPITTLTVIRQLHDALAVICLDERIQAWLRRHDLMALHQAESALALYRRWQIGADLDEEAPHG